MTVEENNENGICIYLVAYEIDPRTLQGKSLRDQQKKLAKDAENAMELLTTTLNMNNIPEAAIKNALLSLFISTIPEKDRANAFKMMYEVLIKKYPDETLPPFRED